MVLLLDINNFILKYLIAEDITTKKQVSLRATEVILPLAVALIATEVILPPAVALMATEVILSLTK